MNVACRSGSTSRAIDAWSAARERRFSVAAVIRDAIDVALPGDRDAKRVAAGEGGFEALLRG